MSYVKTIYIVSALTILFIAVLPINSDAADDSNDTPKFAYYENSLYNIERPQFTLSVYGPGNGSMMANKQQITLLVAIAWHTDGDNMITVIGNDMVIAELRQEKMYQLNITIIGNETDKFNLLFVYNNQEVFALHYDTSLAMPSIPYSIYVPLILRPEQEEKITLEKREMYVLMVEYQKEIEKAQTLIFIVLLILIFPFLANKIKNIIKYEDMVNSVNIVLILVAYIITYAIVIVSNRNLYAGMDMLVPVFKHDIYRIVFLAKLLVGLLVTTSGVASYFVGWKLTELENVHPMLVVSPKDRYIELWYLVIYKAKVNGVYETCVAPVNFGSAWKRLFGHHIVLQRQVYELELDAESKRIDLIPRDTEAPLESGFSFGRMFTKLYPNLILAEDIELYDDRGEQLAVLMETITPEELELRKTNYKEWRKKYGKKYSLKPVTKLRILLSDTHYNSMRVLYDAEIVPTLLSELKAYKDRYHRLRAMVGEITEAVIGKKLTEEIFVAAPDNTIIGDTHNFVDNLIDSIVFNKPMQELAEEEEIAPEIARMMEEEEGGNPSSP